MLEAECPQTSGKTTESISAENIRLQKEVFKLTKEKNELLKKIAYYEEYTENLQSVLRNLKGSIDLLSKQSALIGEALTSSYETQADIQDEKVTEQQEQHHLQQHQQQDQIKKKMQTASVVPMVRGFPIRRIMIPLQRLNPNSHRHRPNRVHGHRRDPWWREQDQQPQEPQELHRANRVPVRRLQRVDRRQHRVVRPRARHSARTTHRHQEATTTIRERTSSQNRRAGSSHQMLQAVVLLQRLSLTQHQQQQQQQQQQEQQQQQQQQEQVAEQQSEPLRPNSLLSPVVMLRDIAVTMQAAHKESQKPANSTASEKLESVADSSAGPSGVEPPVPPHGGRHYYETDNSSTIIDREIEGAPSDEDKITHSIKLEDDNTSMDTSSNVDLVVAAEQESDESDQKLETSHREPPAAEKTDEMGDQVVLPGPPSAEEAAECSDSAQSSLHPVTEKLFDPVSLKETVSEAEVLSVEDTTIGTGTKADNKQKETTSTSSSSNDTLLEHSDFLLLHTDVDTASKAEVSYKERAQENSEDSIEPCIVENDGAGYSSKEDTHYNKVEIHTTACTSKRKRKGSSSTSGSPAKSSESPSKSSVFGESDEEMEQSPENGCRPKRRCAVRKNYALFFVGWNAD